jgi:hypothetical protein
MLLMKELGSENYSANPECPENRINNWIRQTEFYEKEGMDFK